MRPAGQPGLPGGSQLGNQGCLVGASWATSAAWWGPAGQPALRGGGHTSSSALHSRLEAGSASSAASHSSVAPRCSFSLPLRSRASQAWEASSEEHMMMTSGQQHVVLVSTLLAPCKIRLSPCRNAAMAECKSRLCLPSRELPVRCMLPIHQLGCTQLWPPEGAADPTKTRLSL
jgi:hypothetical protein